MIALVSLFLNNLLPVLLVAGAGYLVGKRLNIHPRQFSQVVLYVFTPCLVFNLLLKSQLDKADILRMIGFAAMVMTLVGLLAWGAGSLLRLERKSLAAVVLASTFMNAGNMGMPVNLFAFGEPGLAYASLYFVASSVLTNSAGVFIASLGSVGVGRSLLNLLKIPTVYALALAGLCLTFGWQLPLPFARSVELLGNAAVPGMLIVLGLQLQRASWGGKTLPLALSGGLRLLVSPAIAWGLCLLWGIQGVQRQVGILQSAMPAAVLNTILATEFDVEPSFVTLAVLTTTLLSPLILTPLMAYLGG